MTTSQFKLRDKVVLNPESEYYGQMGNSKYGTIIDIRTGPYRYHIEWKNGDKNSYRDEDLLPYCLCTIEELNKTSN